MSERAIICVDDEAIQLLALKRELRVAFGNRFAIETATDASQALALLDSLFMEGVEVFLMITDWLMPGIKGDELLFIVNKRHPEIRSIMITGQADEEAKRRCVEVGVLRILGKPWKREDLIATVESADI